MTEFGLPCRTFLRSQQKGSFAFRVGSAITAEEFQTFPPLKGAMMTVSISGLETINANLPGPGICLGSPINLVIDDIYLRRTCEYVA